MARHFFTTWELQALANRTRLMNRMIAILDRKLEREERLCNIALHELAVERGVRNPGDYARVWRRDKLAGERSLLVCKESDPS